MDLSLSCNRFAASCAAFPPIDNSASPSAHCIAADRSWIVRILEMKALRSLGELSYCLYLCHLCILWEFRSRHAGGELLSDALFSFGLAVAFAWVMRRFVELPLQRLRAALSRSPRLVVNV